MAVVFASDAPSATITGRVRRGKLARLAAGVYTDDVISSPDAVVAREWPVIVGRMFPGAVVTDRSATTGGPVDGVLYLARAGRDRDVTLPGLKVSARSGSGPLDGDIGLPGGLYQASQAVRSRRTPGRPGPVADVPAGPWTRPS